MHGKQLQFITIMKNCGDLQVNVTNLAYIVAPLHRTFYAYTHTVAQHSARTIESTFIKQ